MTRINLGIEPTELCDQHLVAEYRELPRLWKYATEPVRAQPGDFVLGRGHVLWCAQYLGTMMLRFEGLVTEMVYRGFQPQYLSPPSFVRGELVPESQIQLARDLLQERIRSKFSSMRTRPRWTRRDPPEWA
jgi:deoxyribonuclease (pyrimidine dimer)